MTQSSDRDDLRALYRRAADAPVATGDRVNNQRVIGFGLIREPGADHMLVEGEEDLSEPPDRPVPCRGRSAGISRGDTSPVHDLPAAVLNSGEHLGESFDQQLSSLGEGGLFIRNLLEKLAEMKHHTWFVGGSVRDLLAPRPGPGAPVSDLDMTGTIGPACLSRIAPLRRSGAADYRCTISPRLVWSVIPPEHPRRLLEYKPLARTWFRFPAWGGTLAEDAATRDLTINALYFDPINDVVADPSGGRAHLLSMPAVAKTPYRGDDPVEQACVILRCVKFKLRWPELDITEMRRWVQGLPDDLAGRIPPARRRWIVTMRRHCVPEPDRGGAELAIAVELGPTAVRLIEELQAGQWQ
jgi:hypothetical protein